ncbi:MAG: GAF domain-containing protein [Anaerolineae bacterium]|nr:GAF domain-containing protein [Anaerolineae bacterium]
MSLRHFLQRLLGFIHWPIRTKLAVIFLLVVILPTSLIGIGYVHYQQGRQIENEQEIRLQALGTYQVSQLEQAMQESELGLAEMVTLLQDVPPAENPTYTFVLDENGNLIDPSAEGDTVQNAADSRGFKMAQHGQAGVGQYYSPLLQTDVMGYYLKKMLLDGSAITLLIETPMSDVRSEAMEQGVFTFLLIGASMLLMGVITTALTTWLIARPISLLTESARQLATGNVNVRVPLQTRRDEIGILNNTLSEVGDQLLSAISELEQRVAERTRNLETTLEIGRVLTNIRDLDMLLEEVVNLIRDQFDVIYHAQVFLIDDETDRAVLRASTGPAGRQLLQRGHYLEVGSQSVLGSVTATGHAVVALDTSHNPIHRRNEFLPDTRAEMALPLRIGARIIGALDLQSTEPDAFSDQDVDLFQGMADQISIAIQNAMLFAESIDRLQEIERLNRSLTETVWSEIEHRRGAEALSAVSGPAPVVAGEWSDLQREAMRTQQIAERIEGDTVTFAVPILLREQVLGAVEWQVPEARYTRDARQTALELTTRLGLTAENIRLFEQSRQAAQRELLVNQISSKLIGSTNIDQILQTAVRELGEALRLPRTAIRLHPPGESADDE